MKNFPPIEDAEAVAKQAREHHAHFSALIAEGAKRSTTMTQMQQRLDDLLPFIASRCRIDARRNHLGQAKPLEETEYAGHLSVTIGDLIRAEAGEHFPEIWRTAITAYFEAGYFDVDDYDAFVHPIPHACTPLEKAMRVGSGTAAATLIDLGADIRRVPHETFVEFDETTVEQCIEIKAGDFDSLVDYLRPKSPKAIATVLDALMRRSMNTAQDLTPSAPAPTRQAINSRRTVL